MTSLFDPLTIGTCTLPNRIIMAPMTRGRAEDNGIPGSLMAHYYQARAQAGLIITEATAISPQGYGWLNAPGIWNDAQLNGWKSVTQAVHAKGGHIFLQLWHTGRVSHPDFLKGELPVSPSALAAQGFTNTPMGKQPYVIPHALSIPEIKNIVADYIEAAKRAMAAGFNGVELHAANGYLVDQFIRDSSNKRTDEYGGTLANRLRFLMEVTEALANTIGSDKVSVRLSPVSPYNDMQDSDPIQTFTQAAKQLNDLNLAYLHTMEALPGHMLAGKGERVTPHMRKVYQGTLITNGGYNKASASKTLAENEADAIAFGLPFLANPDLVSRFKKNESLNSPDFKTLYSPGEKGYSDYPIIDKN